MEIASAFPNEVDAIMQVIEGAKNVWQKLAALQWQNGYPDADTIIEDIISGQAYVAVEEAENLSSCSSDQESRKLMKPFMMETVGRESGT